jgi:NitT/TauT family transport system ATP-binding protein
LSTQLGRLDVHEVTKSFDDASRTTLVVDRCSFSLEPDKLTVMVGPSGCGKSTLINLIAGFGPLSRGTEEHAEVLERGRSLLEKVELRGFADRYPTQLSGGMQRRVELARAIINEPRVMPWTTRPEVSMR